MTDMSRSTTLARRLSASLNDNQRDGVREWLQLLLELRAANLPARAKAKEAIRITARRDLVRPVTGALSAGIRDKVWTERSWAVRLGFGAAAVSAVTLAGEGAGIAALGGAIGVPLWVVFGAGASFAGILLDELERSRGAAPPAADLERIPEADWDFVDNAETHIVASLEAGEELVSRPSVWRTFRSAYHSARERQKQDAAASDNRLTSG